MFFAPRFDSDVLRFRPDGVRAFLRSVACAASTLTCEALYAGRKDRAVETLSDMGIEVVMSVSGFVTEDVKALASFV